MSVLKPIYRAYEWYISRTLKLDDMPKHIAVMMDGNRRYARFQGNMTPVDGHKQGRNTLEEFLGWCVDLGIEIVTVYAFSNKNFKEAIKIAEASTASYKRMLLNVAVGYDGRLEIVDAIKKISGNVKKGKLNPEDINEEIVNENLYTAGIDDPNLIIRTSGEERFSGFLLWQASYSELYFCDSYWPAFRRVDFLRALRSYQQRERRFGA